MKHIHYTGTDNHASKYDLNWIKTQHRLEIIPEPILWDVNEVKKSLPIVQDDGTEKNFKLLVKSILEFGIGIIQNVSIPFPTVFNNGTEKNMWKFVTHQVPTTLEATETVATRIAPVMHTTYGGMWHIDTNGFDQYQDTAYTNQELAVHTDNTYFIEPAGCGLSLVFNS